MGSFKHATDLTKSVIVAFLWVLLLSGCVESTGTGNTADDTSGIDVGLVLDVGEDVAAEDVGIEDVGNSADAPPMNDLVEDTQPEPIDIAADVSGEDAGMEDAPAAEDIAVDDSASDDTGGDDKPKSPVQKLCEATDGEWDEASCGHWKCGEEPTCEAIIPGCNCGQGKVFDGGVGCIPSEECQGDFGPKDLCEVSGGKWLTDTCGDWACGVEPLCEAIIPGCNCGAGMVYDEEAGCIMSPECEEEVDNTKEKVCISTGGAWLPTTCGDWKCGVEPLCKAIIPGCNCGKGMNFHPEKGCFKDPNCNAIGVPNEEETLCLDTGGSWLPNSCGHWKCGKAPLCEAIIPGCNCGPNSTFDTEEGCIVNPNCGPIPANDPFSLCMNSGGSWDVNSCGSWECGVAPKPCDKPQGGCNCGKGMILVKEYGCLDSVYCEGADEAEMCKETGGKYLDDVCGNFYCGNEPQNCVMTGPGCDCGKDSLFFPKYGCNVSNQCK